jgi:hypothetical protein
MTKHCYALLNANGDILQTTEERETAPPNVAFCIWQQCYDTAPAHNPDLHERHSPTFRMDGHRVVREFQIRRKV